MEEDRKKKKEDSYIKSVIALFKSPKEVISFFSSSDESISAKISEKSCKVIINVLIIDFGYEISHKNKQKNCPFQKSILVKKNCILKKAINPLFFKSFCHRNLLSPVSM